MPSHDAGWDWFNGASPSQGGEDLKQDLAAAAAFARCFRGKDGEQALSHLRAMTMELALGPGAPDALLRHMEGQRQLVSYIQAIIKRGQGG